MCLITGSRPHQTLENSTWASGEKGTAVRPREVPLSLEESAGRWAQWWSLASMLRPEAWPLPIREGKMHFTEHQGVSKFLIQVLMTMCLRSHRWNDYRLPEEYISEEPPTFVFLLFMDSAAGKIPSLCFLAFRNVSSCFVCLLFFFPSQTHVFCLVLLLSTPQLWSMSDLNLLFSHSHQTLVFCFVAILLFFFFKLYICIALTSILTTRAQPWNAFV